MIFFNRVPKVGSEQLVELLNRLSEKNGFTTSRAPFSQAIKARMTEFEQEDLADDIYDMGEQHVYTMHANYIDFRNFDLPLPIYVNLIRDPVERVISWFYYRRTPWNAVQMYKITNHFFDGSWYKKDFEQCVLSGDKECLYIPNSGFFKQNIDHKRQTLFFCGHHKLCE